jgi:hypothetical protein
MYINVEFHVPTAEKIDIPGEYVTSTSRVEE